LCEFNGDPNLLTEFKGYLTNLNDLPSGRKIIEHLNNLITNQPTVHLKIERAEGEFAENLSVSDIGSDGRVVIGLPAPPSTGVINVPILVRTKDESYTTKDVSVPCFIGMGHELIHCIHKVEAFQNQTSVQDINNWTEHRSHLRMIATCYGFKPSEGDSDSDDSVGLMDFEGNENPYSTNFLDPWGSTKAYEEFRTIVGKETSILTKNEQQSFSTYDTEISERHLLSDYFSLKYLRDDLTDDSSFITRWTHALKAEDVSPATYQIVKSVLIQDDIDKLPRIKQQSS
jgi:hypothetical protein